MRLGMYVVFLAIGIMCCTNAYAETYIPLHDSFGVSPGKITKTMTYIGDFRVFIPPGTKSVSLTISCDKDSYWIGTVARFGTFTTGYGSEKRTGGYTLDELRTDNRFSVNQNGLITVINQSISPTLSEAQSGWLYVKIIKDGGTLFNNTFTLDIDNTIYNQWYNSKGYDWNTNVNCNCVITGQCGSYPMCQLNPCANVTCRDFGESCQVISGTAQCVCNSSCTGNYQCQGNQCVQVVYTCGTNQYCPDATKSTVSCTGQQCQSYTSCPSTATSCSSGSLISLNNNSTTKACPGTGICISDSCAFCNPWQVCSGGTCIYPQNYEPVRWTVQAKNIQKGSISKILLNSSLNPPKTSPYFMLDPLVQFPTLTGSYDFYALIVDHTGMYVARNDRLGNIVFIQYISGDKIRSYQTLNFPSGWTLNSWSFGDIFEDLMRELRLSQQGCLDGNYRFYVGVAPAGTDISTQSGVASLYAVELYCNQP